MKQPGPVMTAVLACVDRRHSHAIERALADRLGCNPDTFYVHRTLGGGGLFAELQDKWEGVLIEAAKINLETIIKELHAARLVITIHGVGEDGVTGCGAYGLHKCGHHFETPTKSRTFVQEQLRRARESASAWLTDAGLSHVDLEVFEIAIGRRGENVVCDCHAVAPEMAGAAA